MDDNWWLYVPLSRGHSACGWAEHRWPKWLGGYDSWRKDKHPLFNQWRFVRDCEELNHATMLEF